MKPNYTPVVHKIPVVKIKCRHIWINTLQSKYCRKCGKIKIIKQLIDEKENGKN